MFFCLSMEYTYCLEGKTLKNSKTAILPRTNYICIIVSLAPNIGMFCISLLCSSTTKASSLFDIVSFKTVICKP